MNGKVGERIVHASSVAPRLRGLEDGPHATCRFQIGAIRQTHVSTEVDGVNGSVPQLNEVSAHEQVSHPTQGTERIPKRLQP